MKQAFNLTKLSSFISSRMKHSDHRPHPQQSRESITAQQPRRSPAGGGGVGKGSQNGPPPPASATANSRLSSDQVPPPPSAMMSAAAKYFFSQAGHPVQRKDLQQSQPRNQLSQFEERSAESDAYIDVESDSGPPTTQGNALWQSAPSVFQNSMYRDISLIRQG